MESVIIGMAAVAAIVLVSIFVRTDVNRRQLRRIRFDQLQADRPVLPAAEFAADFGEAIPIDVAARVRRALASVSEEAYSPPREPVDPKRLRPEDDLCEDLGYDLDSLSFLQLVNALEVEFGLRLRLNDLRTPNRMPVTVGRVTRVIATELATLRSA